MLALARQPIESDPLEGIRASAVPVFKNNIPTGISALNDIRVIRSEVIEATFVSRTDRISKSLGLRFENLLQNVIFKRVRVPLCAVGRTWITPPTSLNAFSDPT